MKFSLLIDGDERLKQTASAWDFENPPAKSEDIEAELSRLMSEENGIGFAANQMGFLFRIFAMKIGSEIKFYYNPEVLERSDDEIVTIEEGCLSFPGLFFKVKRPARVTVRYQDRDGSFNEEELSDMSSRCFQHELDHLNGVCFTDRVSKLTLDMARKKLAKNERKK